jgi:branched-chain amino acid transport system substrate-binding protein
VSHAHLQEEFDMRTRLHLTIGLSVVLALGGGATAQAQRTIRIGVLNDMSGPFADLSGKNSVVAAQMAAEDFAKEVGAGAPIVEILSADHQNKADMGLAIVRKWIDQDNVAAVVDVPNSAVALAVNGLLRDKDRAFLASSTATSELTGAQCAPTTVQWTFDTWALANGTARALVKSQADTWFFITADYAFGKALEEDATRVIKATGGKVIGSARLPLNTADFSSALLQAQSSGAKVIGLANAGADTSTAIKQATEFGIGQDGKQRLAGLLVFLTDIDSMGLEGAKGLLLTDSLKLAMATSRFLNPKANERYVKRPRGVAIKSPCIQPSSHAPALAGMWDADSG